MGTATNLQVVWNTPKNLYTYINLPKKYFQIFQPQKIPNLKISNPKKSFDHHCHLKSGVSSLGSRVVKSSWLSAKIATYLVSIGQLHVLCLAFLYGWSFLNKISLDWPLTLTTQLSTLKLSDNPGCLHCHLQTVSLFFPVMPLNNYQNENCSIDKVKNPGN